MPQSDKTLTVAAFIGLRDIDDVYFDKPYYLAPSDRSAEEAFALIRDGMRAAKAAAIAAGGAVPARAHLADPPAWRGSRRDDAELRLRGAFGRGSRSSTFRP